MFELVDVWVCGGVCFVCGSGFVVGFVLFVYVFAFRVCGCYGLVVVVVCCILFYVFMGITVVVLLVAVDYLFWCGWFGCFPFLSYFYMCYYEGWVGCLFVC